LQIQSQAEQQKEEARRQGGGRGNAFERGKREEEEYAQHSWGQKKGGEGREDIDEDDGKPKEAHFLKSILCSDFI
jgi:hypothetical protein